MYNLNKLMRNVLITPAEVIFHAPTKHTLDPRTIEQSIIIAEERFIVNQIGYEFYDGICEEKNKQVTNENIDELQGHFGSDTLKIGDIVNAFEFLSVNNLALWKQLLWKLISECVLLTAFPDYYIQVGTQGAMHTVAPMSPMGGAGDTGPDLQSIKWMMDKKMMDRIDPLFVPLHNYICRSKASFPLYKKECACDEEQNNEKRSDVILGLYNDEHENCGCYEHRSHY